MDKQDVLLDATKIPMHSKHQTIFSRFDSLKDGEFFILHNDHDPVPLYHHLRANHGETFDWEYLERGPMVWEVQITRRLTEAAEPTVGDLVVEDYRKAEVFQKYGISFCCSGKDSLKEACEAKGIDYEVILKELKALDEDKGEKQNNFNSWELDFLSDYIIHNHHSYVKSSIPMLYEFVNKVARVHGGRHPELIEIGRNFITLAEELIDHMDKEEKYFFPYVKKLVEAKKNGEKLPKPGFGTLETPISAHLKEHDSASDLMKDIRGLSDGFTAPASACNTYRTMYAKLNEFDLDLQQHIHLENNILFEKAIALEQEVVA